MTEVKVVAVVLSSTTQTKKLVVAESAVELHRDWLARWGRTRWRGAV